MPRWVYEEDPTNQAPNYRLTGSMPGDHTHVITWILATHDPIFKGKEWTPGKIYKPEDPLTLDGANGDTPF